MVRPWWAVRSELKIGSTASHRRAYCGIGSPGPAHPERRSPPHSPRRTPPPPPASWVWAATGELRKRVVGGSSSFSVRPATGLVGGGDPSTTPPELAVTGWGRARRALEIEAENRAPTTEEPEASPLTSPHLRCER